MSAPPAPDDVRKAKRRQHFIHTATKLFAALGYADCDMERVATELGVAKGTLYLYFSSKQEMFYACVDQGMAELQATMDRVVRPNDDPFQLIARSIWQFLEFFDQHPQQIELLIQERAIFKDRPQPTFFVHRDARRVRWRTIYQQLMDSGRIRNDLAVEDLLDSIGNLLYGTIFTNYFVGRSVPLCQQYRAVAELIFRGILSDSERPEVSLPHPASWQQEPPPGSACQP